MIDGVRIRDAGDQAIVVELGDAIDAQVNARVRRLARVVAEQLAEEIVEVVPTYRSLLVLHDPLRVARSRLLERVEALVAALPPPGAVEQPGRIVHLPACYGGAFGPDLEAVAVHAGLSPDEVIALHSGASYLVYMLGFTPGFGYFGGLPPRLATPRLDTPRPRVLAGSIGIAGPQTGIYPIDSPGGWRLIARTPARLFDPAAASPFLLAPGDSVRFEPISSEELEAIAEGIAAGTYAVRIESPFALRQAQGERESGRSPRGGGGP